MDWTESLRRAIDFMEKHLTEDITPEDVSKEVCISLFYLERGFKVMTGYSLGEYIRCRRLYLSALDILSGRGEKVIDTALKYGYDTPESFTKAFSRFHGVTPSALKKDPYLLRTFLPLKINIVIQGGNSMDFIVEKMSGFKVIGYEKEFSADNSYIEIPKFWSSICAEKLSPLFNKAPETAEEKAIAENCIGEFGVCIDDIGGGAFRYLVAGTYKGGDVPDGMTVYEFPELEWAKFRCTGPMPGALQAVNTKIFREWLPGNPDFEIAMGANIEWYSKGDSSSPDYESAIWIPVRRK
ncbi:MAG: AraC family transcriptional regulator [Oscillospiraceae bacterium]|nr:AraC family transcriptional regulator [Oscillospiraceae bacterium]